MKGIKMYTRIQKKIPQNTECQHLTVFMEAPPRFELGHKGVADLCLTTWLWCRIRKDALL